MTATILISRLISTRRPISCKRWKSSSMSRMLDMGGAPGAATTKNNVRLRDASKNSKVQAVAFDFELLVKAIHEQQQDDDAAAVKETTTRSSNASGRGLPSASSVQPDVDQVQQVANLLKVDLNDSESTTTRRRKSNNYQEDDLSALLGTGDTPKPAASSNSPLEDIRAKYANKLHKKGVEGGLAGVELVKHQREEALKRGDAEGHLAARKIASQQSVGSSSSSAKWMALTGTGKLLSTLTHRSMKIALLPRPPSQHANNNKLPQDRSPKERMQDLTRQLKDVVFDVLIDLPTTTVTSSDDNTNTLQGTMVKTVLDALQLDPKVILLVSDQDAFLRQAKDLGMITCRIRPKNARRGNVSAHYEVETVLQVHDVVNELAGISFNAVLNL